MIPVDLSTSKQVLKPGFKNRREESVHLKNSFPAGFKLNKNVHSSNKSSTSLANKLGQNSVHEIENNSYMSWAKGGDNSKSIEFTDEFDSHLSSQMLNRDPHADMAGPYYSDLMKAKVNDASKYQKTYDPRSLICSIESKEIFLQEKSAAEKAEEAKKYKTSLQHTKVYHAPSALPKLTPSIVTNKTVLSTPQYESWLVSKASHEDERIWAVKGNNGDMNYSAYNFNGGSQSGGVLDSIMSVTAPNSEFHSPPSIKSKQKQLQQQQQPTHQSGGNGNTRHIRTLPLRTSFQNDEIHCDFDGGASSSGFSLSPTTGTVFSTGTGSSSRHLNTHSLHSHPHSQLQASHDIAVASTGSGITEIPSLILPKTITVEIYTQNQMVKSNSVLQSTQYIVKHVNSSVTLGELKSLVISEIIHGIEKAFRLIDDEQQQQQQQSAGYGGMKGVPKMHYNDTVAFDTKQIVLLFSYYNAVICGWREVKTEHDWISAKMTTCGTSTSPNIINNVTKPTVTSFVDGIAALNQSQNNSVTSNSQSKSQSVTSDSTHMSPSHDHQQHQHQQNTIKMMYSLEKNSEFILLKQIEKNYAARRQFLKTRENQVSLERLTQQLAYPSSTVPTNNSGHKYKPLASVNASLGGGIPSFANNSALLYGEVNQSSPNNSGSGGVKNSNVYNSGKDNSPTQYNDSNLNSRATSAKSTVSRRNGMHGTGGANNNNNNNSSVTYANNGYGSSNIASKCGTTNISGRNSRMTASSSSPALLYKSILYPRVNASLAKVSEENRAIAERQDEIARILENKILKTKW